MYHSTAIANNILSRSFKEKNYISPMKLQKILYFVASEYQKATGKPLLIENFSTWAYGPVLYSVYDEFRAFKDKPIKRLARDARGDSRVGDETRDLDLRAALDKVWAKTRNRHAIELSEITHLPGSAWYTAFQSDSKILDTDLIGADNTYYEALGFRK